MKAQQSQPRTLYSGHVYHWQWLGLAVFIVAGALVVYRAAPAPAGNLGTHSAEESLWARAAQNMRSFLNDDRADQFARAEAESHDPATQSVMRYLRVHQVNQPVWDQLVERLRYYWQEN